MSTDSVIMTLQVGQQHACLPAQSMLSFKQYAGRYYSLLIPWKFASREGLAFDANFREGPVNRHRGL